MTRGRDQSGFTVIELAVAASISLVILGATMTLLVSMMKGRQVTARHNDAQQQARQGVDRLARQLRNLASPADVITTTTIQPKSVDR
ncbi:MAG: prepilin-type N-terminal cleavage/methylation domain-containing protein, partial [Solirubrobacterales bacterium]|nr:prepilin-type N-terminal cleavage/methylation domain-containing protein [Solirubrobacterales bacterium]